MLNNDHSDSVSNINLFLAGIEHKAFIIARFATKDDDEAFDIVQDAMMKMAEKHCLLKESEWKPYFFKIVFNKINDWYRRQSVRNRWRSFIYNDSQSGEGVENSVRQYTFREPDEAIRDEELSEQLIKSIKFLSVRQQQVLVLRLWEGMSVAESASIMGCSEGSVKTHFSRAIKKLKVALG